MLARGRRVVAGVGSASVGVVVALASAGSSEQVAGGASPMDAGAVSPLVVRAQRGEVEPPDLDDVEHMCALLTSCIGLPIPPGLVSPDFSSCVRAMRDELTAASAVRFSLLMRECGLASNSCASLATCALRGVDPDA